MALFGFVCRKLQKSSGLTSYKLFFLRSNGVDIKEFLIRKEG